MMQGDTNMLQMRRSVLGKVKKRAYALAPAVAPLFIVFAFMLGYLGGSSKLYLLPGTPARPVSATRSPWGGPGEAERGSTQHARRTGPASGAAAGEGESAGIVQVEANLAQHAQQDLAAVMPLADLPPRPDERCSQLATGDEMFVCRETAAHKLVEDACAALGAAPPQPPFVRARLNLSHWAAQGHKGAGVVTVGWLDMAVDVAGSGEGTAIKTQGAWASAEIHTILLALERVAAANPDGPAPALLDIGAGLGTFSIVAAAFGYTARAFEAAPRSVQAIQQTLCWNAVLRERLTLFPYALGAEEATCATVVEEDGSVNGDVACVGAAHQVKVHGMRGRDAMYKVTLGKHLGGVRSDVMKMKIGGLEPKVLQGAGTALDSVQAALTEVNGIELLKQNSTAQNGTAHDGTAHDSAVRAYLAAWRDLGFEAHVCAGTPLCLDAPRTEPDMVLAHGPAAVLDVTMQRDGGATLPNAKLTIGELPPRADALCTGEGEELYKCREAVAQRLAEDACAALEATPVEPPFARVKFKLSGLLHRGHAGADGTAVPDAFDMAVESGTDIVSDSIRRAGIWEEPELHTVLTALERVAAKADASVPLPSLLDIGANIGTFSLVAAAFGYPVRAFEALPRNAQAIYQTLCWNPVLRKRLTVFPYALGEEEASCAVMSIPGNVANGNLVCSDEQLAQHGDMVQRGVTHAVRLGDYLGGVRSDVMKIDVEGFEPIVLRGAGTALDSVQAALTEVNGIELPKQNGMPFAEITQQYMEAWRALGFALHACGGEAAGGTCLDAPVSPIDAIVSKAPNTIINIMIQRPAFTAVAQPRLTLDLPPRADADCTGTGAALYSCREDVARKLAEEACAELERNPPDPPHARAPFRLSLLTARGHKHATGGTVPDAIDVAVEPAEDIVSNVIKRQGIWEPNELHTVLTALERAAAADAGGATPALLDIGANIGTYAIVAAAFGYPVRAFEAMTRNVQAIQQTLCWNPVLRNRLTLFPYALGEAEASCAVMSGPGNIADGHLVCSDEQLAQHGDMVQRGVAHAVRLGDYLGDVRSDVMKIDVEGFEPIVLRGAGAALDQVQMAATEINGADLARKSNSTFEAITREYLGAWEDRGFSMHLCNQGQTTPCMDMPATTIDAVIAGGPDSLIDLVMQRPPPPP
eukprot:jgi/Ulvmu1/10772/UM069_0006.1